MRAFRRQVGLAVALAAVTAAGGCATTQIPGRPGKSAPARREVHRDRAAAPSILNDQIAELGRSFDGKAGIAIVSLGSDWEAGWNARMLFPQQSCSKLWVALATLDAVDRGEVSLDQRVPLTRGDMTLFHQPLGDQILAGSVQSITIGDLLFAAITQSDNTANDKLLWSIGGPPTVRAMIARKNLGAIRFYDGERALQSKIAGLAWNPAYSIGTAFMDARTALPMPVRQAAFDRYVRDPDDGAAPHAIANALAALKSGELLSRESTAKLLSTMGQTKTGGLRVRAALAPGWEWNHKTGTGQVLNGQIAGINDIGLLTAPDGTVYAVAIMTVPNKSDGSAQQLMRNVTTTIESYHATHPFGG
ncbi:serine hydrolase [Sphingomonas sp.]|uniref:serine hydrolase n=1 Tax=Sphingomonas sp. TaxID=28214 RepID=UPI0025D7555B|nr:serine hydrolase [Sphingomonas sp.]MBV9527292.1 serine hydrolase [Sphingomonas sp.]